MVGTKCDDLQEKIHEFLVYVYIKLKRPLIDQINNSLVVDLRSLNWYCIFIKGMEKIRGRIVGLKYTYTIWSNHCKECNGN